MKRFILKRLGLSVVTVFLVAVIVFFLTHILPGNVARQYLGRGATEEDLIEFRRVFGLDKPLLSQLFNWIRDLLQGDLGTSMQYRGPVSDLLIPAIGYSSKLAGVAFFLIVPISIAGGVIAAMNRGKKVDRIITVGGLSAAVIPEFVWAIVLVLTVGVTFQIFPVTAFPDEGSRTVLNQIWHLILPSISLLLVLFGYIARIARAGVIEALESDYMRTAVLKGLTRRQAVTKHVLRNALLPTIAVIASQVPYLIGGLIAVEIVFNYPGFGTILKGAVDARDYAVLQSGVIISSLVIVGFQLIADILFAVLNPRIRQKVSE
ncbi:MAG: ABC transporter permease [Actinobacteria bacterium]|jgi:peptide/nickel transport system permease protein|nr:ABC transporter permease [Actinomycetota bacterium]NCU81089.1 ABC transporter permease [Acidimicrobiia bacterium]NDC99679.1 ABC transporter permease [bacterium]NBO97357.1 ABC transporter permease [Actinomycetota bacterium]NBP41517.1 ABC transporter permease [Actinomycetota bacterium]